MRCKSVCEWLVIKYGVYEGNGLTMASMATTSFGGSILVLTISETKCAVMPTMQSMAMRERMRTRRKNLARGAAP